MVQFATSTQLTARLSSAYTTPTNADQLLQKASELIDYVTMGAAQISYNDGTQALKDALAMATCDQVEYWLEVGEEHDVVGVTGQVVAGRLMIQRMPPFLGPRPLRGLIAAGLYWAGAAAV